MFPYKCIYPTKPIKKIRGNSRHFFCILGFSCSKTKFPVLSKFKNSKNTAPVSKIQLGVNEENLASN